SSEVYGYFECMGADVPISGIAGDQQAALFGQCCFEKGSAKNTYGTGCFLLAHTGEQAVHRHIGLLTTIAAGERGRPIEYALEGSVFVGGAVVRWLRDELKLIGSASESESCAMQVENSGGVYLVPAFAGLGAPYWDMHARGNIVGLTAGSGKNHIIRAALEAIAYQTEDVLAAMREDMSLVCEGSEITSLKVDGGASANGLLMQMQSDFSHIDVLRSENAEATAMGAAYLAGLAVGFFGGRDELKSKSGKCRAYKPQMDEKERRAHLDGWHRAVKACRVFSEE
ncbi:MAG: glycerol kinase, partial [Clostridia bacterium]|nr:glycerol kinase [Clostridia bacterium]